MNNPFIIAEIGINANGDIDIAKRLIDMAKACGCDAVKFQKRTIDLVYTKAYLDSPRESPWGTTQREQKEGLEFTKGEYDEIDRYCKKIEIDWFASAWDLESQRFLQHYRLKYNKIASPMVNDDDLLEMVAKEGKFTFISTAKADLETRLPIVVSLFRKYGCPFMLLHCVAKYPTPDNECYLNMIPLLKNRFQCPVGYSNHNPSILAPSLAVSLGAEAIELHITLDRTMYGTDQPSSFEMVGLNYVVRDCKRVRGMLG